MSLMTSKEYNEAEIAVDELFADFNDNPKFATAILAIVEQCYRQGLPKQFSDPNHARELFGGAAGICDIFIEEKPEDNLVPEALLYMAYCDYQLGENAAAAESCQEIIIYSPDYEYVHYAQLLIASSYEKLAESGVVSMSEADYQIEQALLSVIEKETKIDKESIARALLELSRWYVKTGEKDLAASFYEEFIMRADDPNSADARAAKAELEKLR